MLGDVAVFHGVTGREFVGTVVVVDAVVFGGSLNLGGPDDDGKGLSVEGVGKAEESLLVAPGRGCFHASVGLAAVESVPVGGVFGLGGQEAAGGGLMLLLLLAAELGSSTPCCRCFHASVGVVAVDPVPVGGVFGLGGQEAGGDGGLLFKNVLGRWAACCRCFHASVELVVRPAILGGTLGLGGQDEGGGGLPLVVVGGAPVLTGNSFDLLMGVHDDGGLLLWGKAVSGGGDDAAAAACGGDFQGFGGAPSEAGCLGGDNERGEVKEEEEEEEEEEEADGDDLGGVQDEGARTGDDGAFFGGEGRHGALPLVAPSGFVPLESCPCPRPLLMFPFLFSKLPLPLVAGVVRVQGDVPPGMPLLPFLLSKLPLSLVAGVVRVHGFAPPEPLFPLFLFSQLPCPQGFAAPDCCASPFFLAVQGVTKVDWGGDAPPFCHGGMPLEVEKALLLLKLDELLSSTTSCSSCASSMVSMVIIIISSLFSLL